jgi:hypothetical protein
MLLFLYTQPVTGSVHGSLSNQIAVTESIATVCERPWNVPTASLHTFAVLIILQ